MRPDRETIRHFRSLIAVALVATAEALCQEQGAPAEAEDAQPQRRIVVSIPDRKLALIEDGRVVKVYPMGQRNFTALRGVDLAFHPGEFAAIVGHSGSGKS